MSLDEKFLEKLEYLMKNNSRKDEYQCSECRDLGYIFVQDEYGNEMAKPCKCLAKRNLQKMLDKCDLNEAFRKKNFSNYICKSPQQYRAKAHNNSGIFYPVVLKDGIVCGNWKPFGTSPEAAFFNHNADTSDISEQWAEYQRFLSS